MAITGINDILSDVKRFTAYTQLQAVRLSKLRAAGMIAQNALYDSRANQAGDITSLPYLDSLGGISVPGTDDETQIASDKVTGSELLVPRLHRNKSWEAADLASFVAGVDVMGSIAQGVGGWRAREEERILMLMLNGILANAVANDEATLVVGDGTLALDAKQVIDASQTKGERKDQLTTIFMHSACHARLQKDNLISFIPASDSRVAVTTYLDKQVVVSDSLPVDVQVLSGPGMFNVGDGTPHKGPVAYWSDPRAGTGSGNDTFIYRRTFIAGVAGYSYSGTGNPNDTLIADETKYTRKIDPKLVPFVFMKSDPSAATAY